MYTLPCLYPFICEWTIRLLPCLRIANKAAVNVEMQVFL